MTDRKKITFRISAFIFLFLMRGLYASSSFAQTDEDTDVISHWLQFTDVKNSLYHHFSGQAHEMLDQRDQRIQSLNTKRQWQQYQEEVREKLYDIVGPFPERTPLRPRITGTLDRPEFTVEKIIYESQPEFYVTAALFLPKNTDLPAPAIIYASGHTANGYRADAYQNKIINLVKKGFVVFAFDPVGQGERLEYLDEETGTSIVGGATNEHSYVGAQTFLTKSSLARYMIWDGIRAVDYLLTRSEVDPERIGITGRSGGGTQSSYVAAFDDRIYASAPENYITSLGYLFNSRGPQDAEQNFYHGIFNGIDHADLLLARAPKPSLLIATTRDFFSIQGARETFADVKRGYSALGKPMHALMVEDDHGHGSTRANREAMYAFFQKHLSHPGSPEDLTVELFDEEELYTTETGQIATSLGGETVFSLHAREAEQFAAKLKEQRNNPNIYDSRLKEEIRQLTGYEQPVEVHPEVFVGRYVREDYVLEKYFIKGEGNYPIPFLLFRPQVETEDLTTRQEAGYSQSLRQNEKDGRIRQQEAKNDLILYLHPEGKAPEAGHEMEIEWLVRQGYTVVAPDLLGTGETGPGLPHGDSYIENISYNQLFAAIQIGRSISGVRAGDINRLIHTVTSMGSISANNVTVWAKGLMTPDALHAAVFNSLIDRLILVDPLLSYQSIACNKWYSPGWANSFVAGALTTYDLPDLAAFIAPRPILYVNIQDENMQPLPEDSNHISSHFEGVHSVYNHRQAEKSPVILTVDEEDDAREQIRHWMEGR